MRRIAFLALFGLSTVAAISASAVTTVQAQTLDVIRGKVTGPDDKPIQNIRVTATSYQGNVSKWNNTDKNGKFAITFPAGEGDYWLSFAGIGYEPVRREIKRIGDEAILVMDMKLKSLVATLDQVNVTANAPRAVPNRNGNTSNIGGGSTALNNNNVSPDLAGNLAALAAGTPGIQLIPGLDGAADMFSALGLSADQNSATFNGLGSAVSALPQDAQVNASVATYSYDPARGNFSGGSLQVSTIPGSNFSVARQSTNAQAPQLQFADEVAEAQNQKYTNVSLGGSASGPLLMDRNFYNTSASYGRRFQDLPSLLSTNSIGLASAGVAADSVNRFLSILNSAKIPASLSGLGNQTVTDDIRLQTNIDISPSNNGTGDMFTFGLVGNYNKSSQVGAGGNSILTVPSHNGETSRWVGQFSAKQSKYIWNSFLSTTNFGASFTGTDNAPYLRSPNGTVRINSSLPDGSAAVRVLSFGGNPTLDVSTRNKRLEGNNSLIWYAGNNRHSLTLTTSANYEQFTTDQSSNLYGTFNFNSLADLQARQAASFSRTLFAPVRNGSQVVGAMSLGDSWLPKTGMQIQYGFRVDANKFIGAPDNNPLVEQKLGIANTELPNSIYISPRLGFQWYYGNTSQIAFIPGAARPPRALIQGGFGMFQNLQGATLASNAVNNTGLPSSTQQISCVGSATPLSNWESYTANLANIPSTCADGSSGTVFSNSAPSVNLFSADYQQPRAWRGNFNWSGPVLDNRFAFAAGIMYSLNLAQADMIDRNFNNVQRFVLDNEGGRPVFANITAIDPTTGNIALKDTRIAPELARVTESRGDLRNDVKQLSLNLRPVTNNPKLIWSLSYQFQDIRDQFRGFTSTVGNPYDTQWGRGLQQGRHTIGLGLQSFPIFDVVYMSANVSLSSGQRFTPSISGDVNGDGSFGNDRAYVFDPKTTADPALGAAMNSLLTTGVTPAKECLLKQIGTLASRGSCGSPWTASAGLNFRFNPSKIGLPKRASVVFSVNNPLGLADMLFHGDDIHGWGMNIAPDPNLLFVRGFDPEAKRYKYEVNQRFGSTRPTQSTIRQLPNVSLSLRLDVGSPRERQLLTQRLDIGRTKERKESGTKMTAAMLKSLGSSTIPNPMALILQQPDSLKLTRKQADSLAVLSRMYTQKADAFWSPTSRSLEALPDEYSHGVAYEQYVRAREQTVDYLMTLVPDVKKLLTSTQKRKLPLQIANYLDIRVLKFLRSSSSGEFR
ncbi:MAG: carboxypeptidase-like regulatory domain-containing protein [Gemmatimonas sp.]